MSGYLEEMIQLSHRDCLQRYAELCEQPEEVQRRVLADILAQTADSEWGRHHGLAQICSAEEFQTRVPVTQWEDYEDQSLRMQAGAESVLFPGRPVHFVLTSGTTHMKRLPESHLGAAAKAVTSKLRTSSLGRLGLALDQGKFLPLANRGVLEHTPAGIPCGSASGLSFQATPEQFRGRTVFPPEVLECEHADSLDYLIMRFALMEPPVLVVGNNAGRLGALFDLAEARWEELLQDVAAGSLSANLELSAELRSRIEALLVADPERAAWLRARGPLPKHYWPNLAVISCWLGGSVGRYLDTVKDRVPETTRFIDCGYGSSEGKFNVPLRAGVPEAPLSLASLFFEFAPLDSPGPPLMAHQVLDGHSYRLLVTNYSGLLRYDMHDLVEVCGLTGKTPNLRFLSKSGDMGNLCGEKFYASYLMEVILEVCSQFQVSPTHFLLVAQEERRGYDLCLETSQEPGLPFLQAVEDRLLATNMPYEAFRKQHLLAPPRLLMMSAGWQEALYRERLKPGISRSQIKLPVVVNQLPHPHMLKATLTL
mgnify:CR=1 FL=1